MLIKRLLRTISPPGLKGSTKDKPIEALRVKKVVIPLAQHIGAPCEPVVEVGDRVKVGTLVGQAKGFVSVPIHSSISGIVTKIENLPHPLLRCALAVAVEGDGDDELDPSITKRPEIEKLSPDEIREIVRSCGVVGLGGAGFPTHIKLNPPKPVDTLIINGAECEPYLTSDYRLMVEKTKETLLGVELASRCLGVEKVYIAIEDNKPEAVRAFEAICDKRYAICVLKSMYPQGGEKQLIKEILGKEIPQGKLPFDIGVVVHNVGTAFAIYEAIYKNKPLYERAVTVTGSCLSDPKNLLVRIGTPIKDLIDFCGPLKEKPAKIIIGGPMMGIAQYSQDVPVIKTTTGIVLLVDKEFKIREEDFCLRCSECINNCPMGLEPCLISLAIEAEDWDLADAYGALECIECGLCSYVCPARRNLVQAIKLAKNRLNEQHA